MGIVQALLGNASEIDTNKLEKELLSVLVEGESIRKAFQLVRDLFVFTEKRLIFIDKQGVSGKKTEFFSIPYQSISHFSVETAGHLDLDSEINIWVKGMRDPVRQQIRGRDNVLELQRTLATFVLKIQE